MAIATITIIEIVVPVAASIALLVIVSLSIRYYRRRKRGPQRRQDSEKGIRTHARVVSETSQPLLSSSGRPQSFGLQSSADHLPMQMPPHFETGPMPARIPPSLVPGRPPRSKHRPTYDPATPYDGPFMRGYSLPPTASDPPISRANTARTQRQPSFLSHPHRTPSGPRQPSRGPSRRQRPMLARLSSVRSTRSKRHYNADDESLSPVSVYSQASATTSVWNAVDNKPWEDWQDSDIPPVPMLPTIPGSPASSHHDQFHDIEAKLKQRAAATNVFSSSSDEEDSLLSESPVTSPLQYDERWTDVLGGDRATTSPKPIVHSNPGSIDYHSPTQEPLVNHTSYLPEYGIVSKSQLAPVEGDVRIPIAAV
ncbi:hypothetical protein K474DRAFT_1498857 [Panus rudis PR-1116 ss-1]|nr:hypothetical protein K474DRAFT_1498857 [Panus rudis PR-1116 ss-1]